MNFEIKPSKEWTPFYGEAADSGLNCVPASWAINGFILEACNFSRARLSISLPEADTDEISFSSYFVSDAPVDVRIKSKNETILRRRYSAGLEKIALEHRFTQPVSDSRIDIFISSVSASSSKLLFIECTTDDRNVPKHKMKFGTRKSARLRKIDQIGSLLFFITFLVTFIFFMEKISFDTANSSVSAGLSVLVGAFVTFWGRIALNLRPVRSVAQTFLTDRRVKVARYILLFVACPLLVYSTLILNCAYSADRYRSNLNRFIFTDRVEYAAAAWRLFPERAETYLAVSRAIADRRIDPQQKREFTAEFTNSVQFGDAQALSKSAVLSFVQMICPCLVGEHENPLLELAHIAPDAQGSPQIINGTGGTEYTLLAQRRLSEISETVFEAKLLQFVLDSALVQDGNSIFGFQDYDAYLAGLEDYISKNSQKVGRSHLFQEALSLLGGGALIKCAPKIGKEPSSREVDLAILNYKRVIQARENSFSRVPQWSRPPNKMTLHALFMTLYGVPTSSEQDWTHELQKSECRPLLQAFRAEFDREIYNSWRGQEAWARGTIFHPEVRGKEGFWRFVEQSLENGWKY